MRPDCARPGAAHQDLVHSSEFRALDSGLITLNSNLRTHNFPAMLCRGLKRLRQGNRPPCGGRKRLPAGGADSASFPVRFLSVLYFQQHDPLRFPVRFAVFPVRFLARSFVFNKIARFVFKKNEFFCPIFCWLRKDSASIYNDLSAFYQTRASFFGATSFHDDPSGTPPVAPPFRVACRAQIPALQSSGAGSGPIRR